jgi:3D (Asp-Asp-Asp) domain-containing protein
MKDRLIDIVLPVALGVISVVIVLTLFSLRPSQPPVERPAPPPAQTQAPPVAPVTPVEPRMPAQTRETAPPEAETAAPQQPEREAPRVAREGEIALNRVGFSFAGVVGACNVELEPWTHVAVSRDLLAEYPCGTRVRITLPEEVAGRTSFEGVVGDTMNPVHERTVNVYVGQDEPAFQYGILEGGVFSGSPR